MQTSVKCALIRACNACLGFEQPRQGQVVNRRQVMGAKARQ